MRARSEMLRAAPTQASPPLSERAQQNYPSSGIQKQDASESPARVTFREFARRVGANVRRARYAGALTQEDAAERTLTLRVFSQLELGHGNPTLRTLFALAKRLDVSVAELVAVVEDDKDGRVPLEARELYPPKRGRKARPTRRSR